MPQTIFPATHLELLEQVAPEPRLRGLTTVAPFALPDLAIENRWVLDL